MTMSMRASVYDANYESIEKSRAGRRAVGWTGLVCVIVFIASAVAAVASEINTLKKWHRPRPIDNRPTEETEKAEMEDAPAALLQVTLLRPRLYRVVVVLLPSRTVSILLNFSLPPLLNVSCLPVALPLRLVRLCLSVITRLEIHRFFFFFFFFSSSS